MQAGYGVREAPWCSAKGLVVCAERKRRRFATLVLALERVGLEQRGAPAACPSRIRSGKGTA